MPIGDRRVGEARSITDQAAGRGKFTPLIDRWHGMARCQRYELLATGGEERIGLDVERGGLLGDEGRERYVNVGFRCRPLS